VLFWILAVVLVLVGVAGTFLPALPGAPLVFFGLLIAAWIDGFQKVGWGVLLLLATLTLLSFGIDLVLTGHGARRTGADRMAVVGAFVGTLIGIFFGLPGLIAGPFVGAFVGELAAKRDLAQAGRAGVGSWIGLMVGMVVRVGLVFSMIGLFVMAYFV